MDLQAISYFLWNVCLLLGLSWLIRDKLTFGAGSFNSGYVHCVWVKTSYWYGCTVMVVFAGPLVELQPKLYTDYYGSSIMPSCLGLWKMLVWVACCKLNEVSKVDHGRLTHDLSWEPSLFSTMLGINAKTFVMTEAQKCDDSL